MEVKDMSTKSLIARMERAADFDYDDEAEELDRRLAAEGKDWSWASNTKIEVRTKP